MEEDDDRGRGGKAVRERRRGMGDAPAAKKSTGFLSMLKSPLALASQAMNSFVSASPRGEARATGPAPRQLEQHLEEPVAVPAPIAAPAVAAPKGEQVAAAISAFVPAVPEANPANPLARLMAEKQAAGWSPSKLNSLSFFLGSHPAASAPALVAQPAPVAENQRPYLGLKYLLRAGPAGLGAPSTWTSQQLSKPGTSQLSQAAAAAAAPRNTGRYAPYTLQPPNKQPPAAQHAAPAGTPRPLLGGAMSFTPYPRATPALPLAPVSAVAHAAADTPAPKSAVPDSSMRLALANAGRYGAASDAPALASVPPVVLGYKAPTPMVPRSGTRAVSFAPASSLQGGTTSGIKRVRDKESPVATPLMGSGIKNLAEYKRQRQRYTQQPAKSILAVGAPSSGKSTPRDNSAPSTANTSAVATPLGSESGHATPEQQGQRVVLGAPTTGMATTDTARRILEALDNMAKAGDHVGATPHAAKATPKPLGAPGATPFTRGAAPPLDRLTPAQTPAPTTGMGLGSGFAFTPAGAAPPTPTVLFPPVGTPQVEASTAPRSMPAPESAAKPATTPASFSQAPAVGFGTTAGLQASATMPQASTPVATLAAPAHHEQPAAKPHDKHTDRHTKSVRFAVPDGDEDGEQAVAPTPAPSKTAGLASLPMFSFGTGGTSEVAKLVRSITGSVTAAHAVAVPQFTFGTGKRIAATPPMPALPAPAIAAELQSQVDQAAAVPLPDDDEGDEGAVEVPQTSQPADAAAAAAPAAGGWGMAFLQKSQADMSAASDAAAKDIDKAKGVSSATPATAPEAAAPTTTGGWDASFLQKTQATLSQASTAVAAEIDKAKPSGATPVTSGGWDASFLQKNQSALTSATDAAAKEIEKAKAPAAAAAPGAAAAPASGGWDMSFLQKSQAAFAAASDATAQEIEKAKTPAPASTDTAGGLSFGAALASSPALTFGAAPATDATPAPAAAAPAPATSGGWDLAFLQKNQSTLIAASDAAAQEIEKAKTPAASLAPTTTPAFNFGSTPAPSAFGSTAAQPSISFGATPAAGSQAAPSPFTFGAAASSAAADTPSAAPSFGTFGQAAAAPGASPFNAAASTPAASSSAPFSFGPTPAASAAPAAAPSPFGISTFGAAQPSSGAGFAFGASPVPVAQSSTPTFTFGATPAPAPAPAASSSSMFGASPAPAGMFGSAPTPEQPAAPSGFGAAGGFAFGDASTPAAAPASSFVFGAPSSTPGGFAFGAASQAAAAPPVASPFGSPFGGQAPSSFGGAPAAVQAGFGQPPAPTFGGSTPFGAGTSTPAFGATPAPADAGSTPFVFGGAAPPSVSPFNGGGGGLFGGGGTPSPAPSAFGGLATPPTLGNAMGNPGATPFAFGGQPAATPGASPFGAPAQPSFGATPDAGGGGFTIGTMGDAGKSDRRKIRAKRHG